MGRRAAHALIRLAADPDPAVRESALYELGLVSLRRASTRRAVTEALLARLEDPEEIPAVRGTAAEQLAFCANTGAMRRRVVAVLLASLLDPVPEVRFWSAYALGTLGVRRARPYLERLTGDTALAEQFWTVGEEASMAIVALDTGWWPPTPGEPEYTGMTVWSSTDTAS